MHHATPAHTRDLRTTLSEVVPILRLAVPVVVGLVSGTMMSVVDTLMIAPLGTDALAAAGLATSALIIVYSSLFGLISVVSVAVAEARGAADGPRLSGHVKNGMVLAGTAACAITAIMIAAFPAFGFLVPSQTVEDLLFPYWSVMAVMLVPYALFGTLRGLYNAVDRPWVAVWIACAGVALNIPLNWALIYGAGLGLVGAGYASLLAKCVSLALAMWHWRSAPGMAPFRHPTPFRLRTIVGHAREGWTVSLGSLGEGSAYAFTGLMMAGFGAAALAANQVVHSIAAILYMVPLGMTAAVAIRMGQAVGLRHAHRFRAIWMAANGIVMIWAALVFGPLLVFRHDIANHLSADPDVIARAAPMFVTMALIQFADGLQSIALGALRGQTDNRVPNAISIAVYWFLALPLAYFVGFVLGFGPNGLLVGYAIGVMAAAIILQARLRQKLTTASRPGA